MTGREVSADKRSGEEEEERESEGGQAEATGQMCRWSSGSGEEERAGRGSIPRPFMNDSSWSGISARTSFASRAMLRTWLPDLSM